jgi:hypothetical protein
MTILTEVVRRRIIIENVFTYIKKWRIYKETIRQKVDSVKKYHHKIWMICGGLYNKYHPKRQK